MSRKSTCLVFIILGIIITVLSLGADQFGIGSYPGINWVQIVGIAAGSTSFLGGLWLSLNRS
jgi:hypothetical protein